MQEMCYCKTQFVTYKTGLVFYTNLTSTKQQQMYCTKLCFHTQCFQVITLNDLEIQYKN